MKTHCLQHKDVVWNHLSVGYESSQLWVRIVWVRNVRGYETSGKPIYGVSYVNLPTLFRNEKVWFYRVS